MADGTGRVAAGTAAADMISSRKSFFAGAAIAADSRTSVSFVGDFKADRVESDRTEDDGLRTDDPEAALLGAVGKRVVAPFDLGISSTSAS